MTRSCFFTSRAPSAAALPTVGHFGQRLCGGGVLGGCEHGCRSHVVPAVCCLPRGVSLGHRGTPAGSNRISFIAPPLRALPGRNAVGSASPPTRPPIIDSACSQSRANGPSLRSLPAARSRGMLFCRPHSAARHPASHPSAQTPCTHRCHDTPETPGLV
jgi:hypothetical protein